MNKRRKVLYVVLICVVLMLCSCTGTKILYKSVSSGLPLWYEKPEFRAGRGQVAFSAMAQESSARQAELVASQSVVDSVAHYLGTEARQEIFREFVLTGEVKEWGLRKVDSYRSQKKNVFTEAVLVVADSEKLQSCMSESMKIRNENKEKVRNLVLEGDAHIKAGEDLTGVECYINSMVLSYGLDAGDPQYSFNVIMNEVLDILKSTRMIMKSGNPAAATCSVRVQRKESMLYENISLCPLKASYKAATGTGSVFTDNFTYLTGEDGVMNFELKNNSALKKGSVVFEYDLDSSLADLQKVAPRTCEMIRRIIAEKALTFEYEREYRMGQLGLAVYEYSKGFSSNDDGTAFEEVRSMFAQDGTECVPFESSETVLDDDSQDEYLAQEFFEKNPDLKSFLLIRVAVSGDDTSSSYSTVVSMEGRAVIYSSKGSISYDSGLINVTGFGQDLQKAEADASKRFCQAVYSLVKGSYV